MKEYFAFQWHITDQCDQRCKHCYIFSEDNSKALLSMTWNEIEDTFYNCLDFVKCMTAYLIFISQEGILFYIRILEAFKINQRP